MLEYSPMSATAEIADYQEHAGRSTISERSAGPAKRYQPRKLAAVFGRRQRLPRGKHLFLAGDPFTSVYSVVSGSFKVYATSIDGDEQALGFFLPGDALGLEAASSRYHMYSAVALEESDVGVLSLKRLQEDPAGSQCPNGPELLQHLCLESIAKNFAALQCRSAKSAEQRLSSFLIGLWERLDTNVQARSELSLTMSRRDIGDYLGLALETISRTLSQLEQQKLLSVRCRCVRILDPDALRRLAGGHWVLPSLPVERTNNVNDSCIEVMT